MSDIDLNFRQLRDFLAVAEELSFRKAAERLNLSQPPLTRSVQALERSLGLKLFDRTTRRVTLTRAGESFMSDARRILQQVMQARQKACAVAQPTRPLYLGFLEPAGSFILPQLLASWHCAMPEIEVRLVQSHPTGQQEALRDGSLDLALIRPPINLTGLSSHQIGVDDMVIAMSAARRPKDGAISMTELATRPFVAYLREYNVGYNQILQRSCAKAGFKPHIIHQVTNTTLLMGLVAADVGVALVSGHLAKSPRPGVAFVPFRSNAPRGRLEVAWRKNDPNPVTQAMLQHVIAAADQMQALRKKTSGEGRLTN